MNRSKFQVENLLSLTGKLDLHFIVFNLELGTWNLELWATRSPANILIAMASAFTISTRAAASRS